MNTKIRELKIVIPPEEQAEHKKLVREWSGDDNPKFYRLHQSSLGSPPVLPTIVQTTNNNH